MFYNVRCEAKAVNWLNIF